MTMETSSKMTIRVAVVDSHPIARNGLVQFLRRQKNVAVIFDAPDFATLLSLAKEVVPDVLIIDLANDGHRDWSMLRLARSTWPGSQMVVYSALHGEDVLAELQRIGIDGFASKSWPMDRVMSIIEPAECDLQPNEVSAGKLSRGASQRLDVATLLTEAELHIFRCIGEGLASVEIARLLKLTNSEFEILRQSIKKKLKIVSASQLSQKAFQWVIEKG